VRWDQKDRGEGKEDLGCEKLLRTESRGKLIFQKVPSDWRTVKEEQGGCGLQIKEGDV